MAFPATRTLMEYLAERDEPKSDGFPESFDRATPGDPQHQDLLQLHLKRRQRQMMLKKMLEDAGFDNVGSMVRFKEAQQTYE